MLATIAIGEQYLQPFMKYAYHTWEMYCHRHDLGLILFDDHLIAKSDPKFKNPFWQKLLIPKVLRESNLKIKSVCHLDTDVIINPFSPNIFDGHDETKVGLVSQMKRMPYDRQEVLRRVAFLRNRYLSSTYPLDSILFASIEQLFEFSSLEPQSDYACTGVFIFSPEHHSDVITNFFNEFDDTVVTPDSGGEELHFNYLIQSKDLDEWLDYRFQAIWIYEVAWKYSFLYDESNRKDLDLVKKCIEASLFSNYFLHFAGPWHESQFWKQVMLFDDPETIERFKDFADYMKVPVTGLPKGSIKPKEIS